MNKEIFSESVVKQQDLMHSMNQDLAKKSASEKLNEEIEAWLAKGNEINIQPAGYSGVFDKEEAKKKRNKSAQQQREQKEFRVKLQQPLLAKWQEKHGEQCWTKLARLTGMQVVASHLSNTFYGRSSFDDEKWLIVRRVLEKDGILK